MNYKTNDLYIVSLAKKTKHEDGIVSYQQLPNKYFAIELKQNISISPQARTFKLLTSGEVFSTDAIYKLCGEKFISSVNPAVSLISELAEIEKLDTKNLEGLENNVLNIGKTEDMTQSLSFNALVLENSH